ncbi:juvenile hormone acid O-methyltransferase-like [Rhipicephalus microplus]|uniref:juvenile hormone acid O-methyltransferase-like n=1 Tax=Rhipicephalus microplus TaxID=6941 RepID=UPI003F6C3F1B
MKLRWESNARLLDTFKNAFAPTITSKTNASDDNLPAPRFIDIGCGTGNFTLNYLLKRCSSQCRELVGVDNSPAMLEYARTHHSHEKIRYEHLDIVEGDVNKFVTEHGRFARAFCFNLMHVVKDNARAMRNMEKLMAPGAECFVIFESCVPMVEVFMALAESPQWKKWLCCQLSLLLGHRRIAPALRMLMEQATTSRNLPSTGPRILDRISAAHA